MTTRRRLHTLSAQLVAAHLHVPTPLKRRPAAPAHTRTRCLASLFPTRPSAHLGIVDKVALHGPFARELDQRLARELVGGLEVARHEHRRKRHVVHLALREQLLGLDRLALRPLGLGLFAGRRALDRANAEHRRRLRAGRERTCTPRRNRMAASRL